MGKDIEGASFFCHGLIGHRDWPVQQFSEEGVWSILANIPRKCCGASLHTTLG